MAKAELIKTRALIEAGWVQGTLVEIVDGQKCYCLDGALAEAHDLFKDGLNYTAMSKSKEFVKDGELLMKVMPTSKSKNYYEGIKNGTYRKAVLDEVLPMMLYWYNDERSTGKDEVIALLDRAISSAAE